MKLSCENRNAVEHINMDIHVVTVILSFVNKFMKLCENDLQFVLNEQITKLHYFTQKNAFYYIQYTCEYVLLKKKIYI